MSGDFALLYRPIVNDRIDFRLPETLHYTFF